MKETTRGFISDVFRFTVLPVFLLVWTLAVHLMESGLILARNLIEMKMEVNISLSHHLKHIILTEVLSGQIKKFIEINLKGN